jgi:hypothetical protein
MGPLLAAPTAVGHDVMSLTPQRQMYIFAKIVADLIFWKKSTFDHPIIG